MKVIAFDRASVADELTALTPADIIPDSATVLKGRPIFIPDFGSGWMARPVIALRIGRLGRDISPKFAMRYVDGITVGIRLILPEGARLASRSLLSAMDSTISFGTWLDPASVTGGSGTVTVGNSASDVTRFADFDFAKEITGAIPLVSRFMTLKNGDVILPASFGEDIPVSPGMTVCATLGSEEVVTLRLV